MKKKKDTIDEEIADLTLDEMGKIEMQMQQKIEDDILNPPDMPHVDEIIDNFFDKLKSNPEETRKKIVKKHQRS